MNIVSMVETLTADLRNHSFGLLIDGQLVPGARSQDVVDPATEQVIARAPVADGEQVDAAVLAAKNAFESWKKTTPAERRIVIENLCESVRQNKERIACIITMENGKPIAAARADVDLSLSWAEHVKGLELRPEVIKDDDESRIEIRHRPIGVVAAIIPWNFPFFQTMYKLVPALMAGNTLVIKPSPTTPLNALVLGELLADIVPPGVVNIIGDDGEVGPTLTSHPDVSKVSFTGSTAVGRHVMASGAATLKRVVLELGGNDAAIVLDDADLDSAVEGIFSWAFMNTGQVCINIKRIFVPDSMYDQFAQAFAQKANEARVGHGLDPNTDFGPVQNVRQFATAKEYLKLANVHGTVIAGGEVLEGPGYFVQPTVVRDIDEDSPLIREETFGPVRSLLRYSDLEEAIRRANDTPYGLGNSVWGSDLDRAAEVADRLESGTVWVNTHFSLAPDVPFGGHKQSGAGVEFGDAGFREFTEAYVINVNKQ